MSRTTTERRPTTRRSVLPLTVLGAAALTAGSLALAPSAWAETAPTPAPTDSASAPTAGQTLNASVEPSVVQLYIEWSGYVAFPTEEGTTWSDELTVASICTGFFVSETGQIATAGHCVDPVEGRHALVDTFLESLVVDGWLYPEEAAGLVDTAYANWPVEGFDAGSEPERIVYAVQPDAVEGIVIEDPLAVQVVDFRPFEQGDVALLKADVTGAVPLPVSADDPTSGAAVTSVGFPGSVQSVVDASRVRASFKTGSVSSQQISDQGVPRTEINADLSGGMSGGPTLDALGNVVGVNSSKINGDQAFNFITDASDLHQWLTAKGVTLAPLHTPAPEPTAEPVAAPAPVEDEAGLATGVLVAGGAAVLGLVVTVGLVLLLVRRGRRRTAPAGLPVATALPAAPAGEALAPTTFDPTAFAPAVFASAPAPGAPLLAPEQQQVAPTVRVGLPTGFAAPAGPAASGSATATGFAGPSGFAAPPAPPAPSAATAAAATAVLTPGALPGTCRTCGAAAVAGQRFCGSCGGQL